MPQRFRCIPGLVLGLLLLLNILHTPLAQAALISTKEEISIGENVAKSLEKKYGLVDDQALQQRVARIGASLVAVSDRPNMPYTFKVLNSKDVNALAAPGGFIYLFKGLTDYMPSDEELAGVISHEVSHIVRRHTVRQMEKDLTAQLLFGVLFGNRNVMLQNLAFNAVMAGYSRKDEREADQVGFQQLLKAGYNPYSMMMTLQKLDDLDRKGRAGIFSSHPDPGARVKLMREYIEKSKIQPAVEVSDQAAVVTEGAWQLPAITVAADGYKPPYRAYLAAGALYQIAQQGSVRANGFFISQTGDKSTIFYDHYKIVTITPADAEAHGLSVASLSEQYLRKLQDWAGLRAKKAA